jgi:hypothetical protein
MKEDFLREFIKMLDIRGITITADASWQIQKSVLE